ncbi:metallophosphoesterase family protein [Oleisolibacter albus]|uniref:metallophosphoesterase family protein n=1 Tax=Oleisolibacter albus TaxID=2171757 RepID=UPI001874475F|nr:metallophosphoesterase family protein [Oleisolibacter albus]
MLTRLRQFLRPSWRMLPAVPPGLRLYAIGDIHGRCDLLQRLLVRIAADAAGFSGRTHLVFLGDYIDRGLESAGVIEYVLQRLDLDAAPVFLKGNHEAALLDFLTDRTVGRNWLAFGGDATLLSYGVPPDLVQRPGDYRALQAALHQRLPPAHLAFLSGLRLQHHVGDYLFVHAGIRPGVALERQSEADLLWIRDPFLQSRARHGAMVVHGHSMTEWPDVRDNRIGIDTGAFATGRLTALVLEGQERRFLHT